MSLRLLLLLPLTLTIACGTAPSDTDDDDDDDETTDVRGGLGGGQGGRPGASSPASFCDAAATCADDRNGAFDDGACDEQQEMLSDEVEAAGCAVELDLHRQCLELDGRCTLDGYLSEDTCAATERVYLDCLAGGGAAGAQALAVESCQRMARCDANRTWDLAELPPRTFEECVDELDGILEDGCERAFGRLQSCLLQEWSCEPGGLYVEGCDDALIAYVECFQ